MLRRLLPLTRKPLLNLHAHLSKYQDATLIARQMADVEANLEFAQAAWKLSSGSEPLSAEQGIEYHQEFHVETGQAESVGVGLEFTLDDWTVDHYLVLPAAVYNGNRFAARVIPYSPKFAQEDLGQDQATLVSDVPRLNVHAGPSRLQQLTRDLATPAVGIFDPHRHQGLWLLIDPATPLGDTGIDAEENLDRTQAIVRFTCPGVREAVRYSICNSQVPSTDRGATLRAGQSVHLRVRAYRFACADIPALFDRFVELRKVMVESVPQRKQLPFSAAFDLIQSKYNDQNWTEPEGYYAVGMRENKGQDWQLGWTGGAISTLPLLAEGSELSRQRVRRNLEWLFAHGQTPAGYFRTFYHRGEWMDDHLNSHLVRRAGDALFYLIKQFHVLQAQGQDIPQTWHDATRRLADALMQTWRDHRQFGQYVDPRAGRMLIGGSTGGGIVPAGLVQASRYFEQGEYLEVAAASAATLYQRFVQRGYTTGGPGDCLQCPDSESAAGLLESLTSLWEATGQSHWLEKAQAMAHQAASWVMSYDYAFPPDSTFGRLGMQTTGSVFANVQNKHSAPGLCSYSGSAFLRLFRATGRLLYLELMRDIAHSLPQYLSRSDRPICSQDGKPMCEGWMNERVNTSDWLEPIGEIFHGSCWCEVSMMLTCMEIPVCMSSPAQGWCARSITWRHV
jgi:hypothetical protein